MPVTEGSHPGEALARSLALIRHAEALGYRRYWVAEHHNMRGIASAATAVVIGHLAGGSSRIRVGAGGIMLPNHAPLVVAEQFGTLASLYPGRIDLGLGRAPGTDGLTLQALRRSPEMAEHFPQDVLELQAYLGPAREDQAVRAVPGEGTEVPLWILGSSLFGAQLAAALGLPYAFASHFAPDSLLPALRIYRERFRPSAQLDRPYAMAGLNVVVADEAAEARRQFSSVQQSFARAVRGTRGLFPPPVDDIEAFWTPTEKAHAERMLARAVVGEPAAVADGLAAFVQETGVDEVMVVCSVFDHQARMRSYELLAQAVGLTPTPA